MLWSKVSRAPPPPPSSLKANRSEFIYSKGRIEYASQFNQQWLDRPVRGNHH